MNELINEGVMQVTTARTKNEFNCVTVELWPVHQGSRHTVALLFLVMQS